MRLETKHIAAGVMLAALGWLAAPAAAQLTGGPTPAEQRGAGLDEQLGQRVSDDLAFVDEKGQPVTIGAYLGGEKPLLLNFVYHDCPMLCSLVLDGLTASLKDLAWTPGQEFDVLTVSFAANETPALAARQKAKYVERLGRPAAAQGWHFLTGEEENIQALAASVGFEFVWDEQAQQYAHPATLIFLSPDGTITRYLYGLEYPARHVRNALVEASDGTVGTTLDRVILYCFQYDPAANSYVPHAVNIMKTGGLLTMLVLGSLLAFYWRRERKKHQTLALET